jgi:hypothetical protein
VITALDHIALPVREFDAAVDGYTRLTGRMPNWMGRGRGVGQTCFKFPQMALDVLGPEGEGALAEGMRTHSRHDRRGFLGRQLGARPTAGPREPVVETRQPAVETA